MIKIVTIFLLTFSSFIADAQQRVNFKKIVSSKNRYSIEVPETFSPKTIVGKNVEYSFDNPDHVTFVMVVRNCTECTTSALEEWAKLPFSEHVRTMKEDGLENVMMTQSFVSTLNGQKSVTQYYTNQVSGITVYNESITQLLDGKIFSLSLTCANILKPSYQPYFYRIKNSLIHF